MAIYNCTYNPINTIVTAGKKRGSKQRRDSQTEYSLYSRTNRRHNKLRYIVESLEKEPTHFITLNCETDDIDTAIMRFNQFATRVREKFKGSWFIWKMDCNHHVLHYHIIGSFNEEKPSVDYDSWVYKRWSKIWGGIKDSSVDVREIKQGPNDSSKVKNYLLKRDRRNSELYLNSILGKKYSFGFINSKNVPSCKAISVVIDEKKLQELKGFIIEDLQMQDLEPRYRENKIRNIINQNYLNHRFHIPKLHKQFIKALHS